MDELLPQAPTLERLLPTLLALVGFVVRGGGPGLGKGCQKLVLLRQEAWGCRSFGLMKRLKLPSFPSCLKDKQSEQLKLEINELFEPFPEEPKAPTLKKVLS